MYSYIRTLRRRKIQKFEHKYSVEMKIIFKMSAEKRKLLGAKIIKNTLKRQNKPLYLDRR